MEDEAPREEEEARQPDREEEEARQPDEVEEGGPDDPNRSAVTHPSKLIRIASMTRALLSEAREAELDEPGRQRLIGIHDRTLVEMKEVLSEDLQEELAEMFLPLSGDPTDSELRLAQAQLVGWLEGLFAGIQASLVSQQIMTQQQLAEMSRPQLRQGEGDESGEYPGGTYL